MRTERINEWIVKYNEGTLEGSDLEEFVRLLAENPDLRKELQLDKEIDKMLLERDLLEFRKAILKAREGRSSGNLRWLLLAATLAVLLIGGGFILYRVLFLGAPEPGSVNTPATFSESGRRESMHEDQNNLTLVSSDTTVKKKKSLLAERFVPLASMESLVGESTRSDDFLLKEPRAIRKIICGDSLLFSWTTESADPIEICLFDNKGNKVHSAMESGKTNYMLKTAQFEPGLYYWKLLKNDQIVTAGKIRME